MVQWGGSDYSMSIGLPGQWKHPKVEEAYRYTIETAIKMGVRPRVELLDVDQAEPFLEMGVKDFCIGWDVFTIYNYCKYQGEALGKRLGR